MAIVVTESGLTLEDLAITAYQALWNAKGGVNPDGQPLPSFDDIDEDVAQAWGQVAKMAVDMVEHGAEEKPDIIARLLFSRWHERATGEKSPVPFEGLHRSDRLAWEAVARHLAYVVDMESEEDLSELERKWKTWAQQKQ